MPLIIVTERRHKIMTRIELIFFVLIIAFLSAAQSFLIIVEKGRKLYNPNSHLSKRDRLSHTRFHAKRKKSSPPVPETVEIVEPSRDPSLLVGVGDPSDLNPGIFPDNNDPEDEAQKQRETRQRLLAENQQLQRLFEEQKSKRSMYGDTTMDEDSLAMEAAREQYERIINRVEDQIRLNAQLSQISLERTVQQDGKEYWEHPLYQELGITLPSPRGKTPEEFDLIENLELLQSSFLGLRPSPQFNETSMAGRTSTSPSEAITPSEEDSSVDPVFRRDSISKRFSKFYPFGFYGHTPLLALKSPFDIFGNLHSQPRQYYKLLPTLDAFRLTQEFWRQHDEREEDLAALWYAEDVSKEKSLKELSPWIRAALFGIDNDNGTDQDLNDKIVKFVEALIYGSIFVLVINIILGISNGLFSFLFREEFEFFSLNEWWKLPLQEILPHLPKFEPVHLSTFSKSLYGVTPPTSPSSSP